MRKLLRSALVWLVMLALPMQGMAAAAMMHCGAGEHPTTATANPGHNTHRHDHGAFMPVDHVQASVPVEPKIHTHAETAKSDTPHQHASHHHAAQAEPLQVGADTGVGAQPTQSAFADHQDSDTSQVKCSACASCCSASAIPPSALQLAGVSLPPHGLHSDIPSQPSFITDGPRRPPRSLLV